MKKDENQGNHQTKSDTPKAKGIRKPEEFKIGGLDLQGRKIEHVYVTGVEYVVYRTNQGIKVYIYDELLPDEERVLWKNFVKISNQLGRIYALQPEELSSVESINKTIARAITQSIEGHLADAVELLNNAESRLIRLRCLKGRLEYLISAGITVFTFIIMLSIIQFLSRYISIPDELIMILKVTTCGALGGFLSVSINVWKLNIDLDANRILNAASGSSRIVIASVAAVFAFFAVKSELILGTLSKTIYGIYIASMVAGFSEKFIPNIIRSISKDEREKEIDKAISCNK